MPVEDVPVVIAVGRKNLSLAIRRANAGEVIALVKGQSAQVLHPRAMGFQLPDIYGHLGIELQNGEALDFRAGIPTTRRSIQDYLGPAPWKNLLPSWPFSRNPSRCCKDRSSIPRH
jgi:hypothetical protein